jgi:hypothetical protein
VRRKANYLTVAPFIYPVCYSASEIQTNEMATEMRNARRLSCANIRDIQVGRITMAIRRARRERILVMESAQHRFCVHDRTRRQSVSGL